MVENTFVFGGLDHLGQEMQHMPFLPRGVASRWRDLGPNIGCEGPGNTRCHPIHAASIPASHEMMAYGGVVRLRAQNFRQKLEAEFGPARAGSLLSDMTVAQRRCWTQLAFGRPNGGEYRPGAGPGQLGSGDAGLVTILSAGHHYEDAEGRTFTLDSIFTEATFARMASVRIARARAVEAALVDRYGLLTTGYQPARGSSTTQPGATSPGPAVP